MNAHERNGYDAVVSTMSPHEFTKYYTCETAALEKISMHASSVTVRVSGSGSTSAYFLAAGPGDRSHSFTGSMLPFATEEMALEGSENRGIANVEDDVCVINIKIPNAYYKNRDLIPPTIYLLIGDVVYSVQVAQSVPYRTLAGLVYDNPDAFRTQYAARAQSQESWLLSKAYPACVQQTVDFA